MAEDIKKELSELVGLLKSNYKQKKLWDKSDIKDFFGVKLTTVHKILRQPTFPQPIRPCPGAHPKWVRLEVERWALLQRAEVA